MSSSTIGTNALPKGSFVGYSSCDLYTSSLGTFNSEHFNPVLPEKRWIDYRKD